MAHPVCTETQDAVQEGVHFRCHVTRMREFNSSPFKEFPNSRYMYEIYEIRVWATPINNFTELVALTSTLNCSKLYEGEDVEFENPEGEIESTIDLLCAKIWQHALVCKFRAHAMTPVDTDDSKFRAHVMTPVG